MRGQNHFEQEYGRGGNSFPFFRSDDGLFLSDDDGALSPTPRPQSPSTDSLTALNEPPDQVGEVPEADASATSSDDWQDKFDKRRAKSLPFLTDVAAGSAALPGANVVRRTTRRTIFHRKTTVQTRRKQLAPVIFIGPTTGARLVRNYYPGNDPVNGKFWWQKVPEEVEVQDEKTQQNNKPRPKKFSTKDVGVGSEDEGGSSPTTVSPPAQRRGRPLTAKQWLETFGNDTDQWLASLAPEGKEAEAIRTEETIWVPLPNWFNDLVDDLKLHWEKAEDPQGAVATGKNHETPSVSDARTAETTASSGRTAAAEKTEKRGSTDPSRSPGEQLLPPAYRLSAPPKNLSGPAGFRNILPFRNVSPAEAYAVPWNVLIFASLLRSGYSRRRTGNIFYDWRKGPQEWAADGTFEQGKMILELYRARFGKPAILISWSMGGVFVHAFLDWLEKSVGAEELARVVGQYEEVEEVLGKEMRRQGGEQHEGRGEEPMTRPPQYGEDVGSVASEDEGTTASVGNSSGVLRTSVGAAVASTPDGVPASTNVDPVPQRDLRPEPPPRQEQMTPQTRLARRYKAQHIAHWTTIAAPFGGSAQAFHCSLMASARSATWMWVGNVMPWIKSDDLRLIVASWPGSAALQPQPGFQPKRADSVVRDGRGNIIARFEGVIALQRSLVAVDEEGEMLLEPLEATKIITADAGERAAGTKSMMNRRRTWAGEDDGSSPSYPGGQKVGSML